MLNLNSVKSKISKILLGNAVFLSSFLFLNYSNIAQALNPDITIPLGQVAPFQVPEGITTLVIGDPKIANVVIPPGQNKTALINTQSAGTTNILVWTEKGGQPSNFILEVQDNKRDEQIVTRVKVLEVSTGGDGKFGVDWLDTLTFKEAMPSAPFKFGLPIRTSLIEAKINTLLNDRKATMLAQPTLVSLNGKSAKFLSGGEYPVVIYERDKVNIQWKEYGIKLDITANVQGSDNILISVKPEVSAVDRAGSVVLTGTQNTGSAIIPAFTTSKAESTLVLRDNESLVIAGLMTTSKDYVDTKVPLLGDIPVLGYLFKSREFREIKKELIFLVSPSILKKAKDLAENNYASEAKNN